MAEAREASRTKERATLIQILSSLVDHLAGLGEGKGPAGRPEPRLARWADDGYIDFEADLSRVTALEADLSVHRGKVFIRVEA